MFVRACVMCVPVHVCGGSGHVCMCMHVCVMCVLVHVCVGGVCMGVYTLDGKQWYRFCVPLQM